MSLFSCKFYKAYFYFIIYWVLDLLNNLGWENFIFKYNYTYYKDNFSDYKDNKYYFPFAVETELLNLVNLILADLSFGFLVAYTYIRMKHLRKHKNENNLKTNKNILELIYNKPSNPKNTLTLIIIISLLDFVARIIELFFFLTICQEKAEEKQIRWLITIEILPRIIFSYIILKVKFYRHHFLSLLFFFVGFLIISILGINSIEAKNQTMYILIMFVPKILYALEDSINKIILTDKFVLPHFLLFFRGLINVILALILIFVLNSTSHIDFRYYNNILNNIQVYEILLRLFSFICMILKIFCIFKIIYIFSPLHVGFCIVILYIFNAIKNMILDGEFENKLFYCILNVISLLFIGIGTLIFNEMLIINYWGLNENTKSGQIKKEILETRELQGSTINSDDSEDDEDNEENYNQIVKEPEIN